MISAFCLVAALALPVGDHGANTLFDSLVNQGVALPGGAAATLPPPNMPDGLTGDQQLQAIDRVPGRSIPTSELLRNSIQAGRVLQITSGTPTADGVVRRVDLSFLAYGDFDRVTDPEFLEERLKVEQQNEPEEGELPREAKVLTDEQLGARGLTSSDTDALRETYSYSLFQVFEKVQVAMTSHVMQTRSDDSVLVAAVTDPRFVQDPEFANRWWPLTRLSGGQMSLGDPQPYAGMALYAKLTRLQQPQGAIFVELHLVFYEPKGWFNGVNLLASKLPLLVQEKLKDFRREVAAAGSSQ